MKAVFAVTSMFIAIAIAMTATAFAAAQTNQISFRYVPPKNPAHQKVYKSLKDRRVLEKLQEFLRPFKLPRRLQFSLAGCDGEDDATYGDDTITICYEFADKLVKNMPAKTTVAGITPIDTVLGPFFTTCLHEFAHALFDMLKVPLLGREEDAADLVAAYMSLQLGEVEARRVITGAARGFFIAAQSDDAAVTAEEFDEDFAETHSTPKQRAYNILCIAYGADTKLFGDFVTEGYLPKSRAKTCEEEYEQVQDAYEKLIHPHIDHAMAAKVLDQNWFRKPAKQDQRSSP